METLEISITLPKRKFAELKQALLTEDVFNKSEKHGVQCELFQNFNSESDLTLVIKAISKEQIEDFKKGDNYNYIMGALKTLGSIISTRQYITTNLIKP